MISAVLNPAEFWHAVKKVYATAWMICLVSIILLSNTAWALENLEKCGHDLTRSVKFQKGFTNPFAGDDDRIVLDPKDLHIRVGKLDGQALTSAPTLLLQRVGEDLNFATKFRGHNSFARVELSRIEGEVTTVILASDAESIVQGENKLFPGTLRIPEEVATARSHVSSFYGFSFIAQADRPVEGRLVLQTDVSEERGRQLGGIFTYEASFQPPVGSEGYVNVPFSDFKAYLNGALLAEEPGPWSAQYPSHSLKPKSLALELRNSAEAEGLVNFRIRKSEIGAGFFFGLRPDEAAQAAVQAVFPHNKQNAEIFARLILKMRERVYDFPEGREFAALKSDRERRAWVEAHLNEITQMRRGGNKRLVLARDGSLQDLMGKVDIYDLWVSLELMAALPTENGYFGAIHGRYTHALQMIALLKDSSPAENWALFSVFESKEQFALLWNFIFDGRTGGANDPAVWRRLYEPPLPSEGVQQLN